jgi:hypothetical protein
MKPSSVKSSLSVAIKARRPVFLWGPPGVGKSQVVAQVADAAGLGLVDVRAVLLDPVDLRGLPHINGEGRAHWAIPDFLPKDGQGIIFLDELNAAPPLVQASCYQLILDRKLGEYSLPDSWSIIAAGNRETDRAVTSRMSSALANRFVHLNFEVDLNDWVSWALAAGVQVEVIAFIRFRPVLLHVFDPVKNEKTFPSPRTWEYVSDILRAIPDPSVEFELIAGTVGEGAAAEFMGFLKIYRELPDPDAVLLDPAGSPVPGDPAALYAICGALSRKSSVSNFGRVVQYGARLPVEFSVLLVRDSVKLHPEVQKSRAFIEWSSANSQVLI